MLLFGTLDLCYTIDLCAMVVVCFENNRCRGNCSSISIEMGGCDSIQSLLNLYERDGVLGIVISSCWWPIATVHRVHTALRYVETFLNYFRFSIWCTIVHSIHDFEKDEWWFTERSYPPILLVAFGSKKNDSVFCKNTFSSFN